MSDQNRNTPLTPVAPSSAPASVPTSIALGSGQTVDLSFIPEAQRSVILAEYMRGNMNIALRANELHVNVLTLKNTLDALVGSVNQVAKDGNSVTITNTQDTPLGRTEIIMGNTETAGKGRLTRSQVGGETNWIPYYIFAAIAAFAVIVIAIVSRGH
jgi:hypothetical protein